MPPTSSSTSGELWGRHLMPAHIEISCCLPNGIMVDVPCSRESSLLELKNFIFKEAVRQPLFDQLAAVVDYVFIGVNQDLVEEEYYDETRRLCDLKLFYPLLKLVEPEGNRQEKIFDYQIGNCIGMSVLELNQKTELETMTFRREIIGVCNKAISCCVSVADGEALYEYPPIIADVATDDNNAIPPFLSKQLKSGNKMLLKVFAMLKADGESNGLESETSHSRHGITIEVSVQWKPHDVVREVYRRHFTKNRTEIASDQLEQLVASTVLKVCGQLQVFLSEIPIIRYKYFQSCIRSDEQPTLMLVRRQQVLQSVVARSPVVPPYLQSGKSKLDLAKAQPFADLWQFNEPFRLRINFVSFVNVRAGSRLYVKCGLYLGSVPLCPAVETEMVDSGNPRWSQELGIDVNYADLPRTGRLCFSVCGVDSRKRKRSDHYMVAWANMNVFDFLGFLAPGHRELYMWQPSDLNDNLLAPIGCVGSNPARDACCLDFDVLYPLSGAASSSRRDPLPHLIFPGAKRIAEHGKQLFSANQLNLAALQQANSKAEFLAFCNSIMQKDSELHEQEKQLLWNRRADIFESPECIVQLVASVAWNNKDQVTQLYYVLSQMPPVSSEVALQLLNSRYLDSRVREYAIRCLQCDTALSDEMLTRFLLQLVQVLKTEPYLDNVLTRFLLYRGLRSQVVGHMLFWYLRSEMHDYTQRIRFGLILEALCRCCGQYLNVLERQVKAIEKLGIVSNVLKDANMAAVDEHRRSLLSLIRQDDCVEVLHYFRSPLNSAYRLGALKVDDCKVMNSSKRPLWLVWQNIDPLADVTPTPDYSVIFKIGDDLRQDMLTLQVIDLMDHIWRSEGIDLRLIPYGCLATGKNVGLIEVVRNSTTLGQIKGKAGTGASIGVDTKHLYSWLCEQCRMDRNKIQLAVENFTRSCAGYCVATFVLGIRDRHVDNIMITETGRLFHIDFGHFLDHRKKKFGYTRERVPFVIMDDWVRVIANGADNPESTPEFLRFIELLQNAYCVLRRHGRLLLTLFSMMIHSALPELQSERDLAYLKKTLALGASDDAAMKFISEQLKLALSGKTSVNIDTLFHLLKQVF